MSTIFFDAEELANVAVAVANLLSSTGEENARLVASLCAVFSYYSEANANAYNVRYREDAEAFTAHELLDAALALDDHDLVRAARTAALLVYNADGLLSEKLEASMNHLKAVLSPWNERYATL